MRFLNYEVPYKIQKFFTLFSNVQLKSDETAQLLNKPYVLPYFLTIYFEIKVIVHFSHQSLCSGGKNGL